MISNKIKKFKSVPYLLTLTSLFVVQFTSNAKAESWQNIPGCGKDIGAGSNNSAWVLGCSSGGAGGYEIFNWNGTTWGQVDGAASAIAVSPEGTPWVVTTDGSIWKRENNSWQKLPGCGKDIGVGSNNSAWVLGCSSGGAGGYEIFNWNGTTWEQVDGAASAIAVSPEGTPWVVATDGTIWKRENNSWQNIPGCGKDIGVGSNNSAWVLSCSSGGAGGYEIFNWNGTTWEQVDGAASAIAVSPEGTPWVVATDGSIWKRN